MVRLLRPKGLVVSPAFTHVAVIPADSTIIVIGGQNAVDAAGSLVGGEDVAAQTAQVMANLGTALAAGGAGPADLISVSILGVSGIDWNAAYAVAAKSFDPEHDPPLVTAAEVVGLAVPGALIEVSAMAAVST